MHVEETHAVVLEIFCGTAGVSASLKRLGCDVIAVDKFSPKSPKVMVTRLDLTQTDSQQLVFDWISLPQVKGVYLAPPCGTASLARTIQSDQDPSLPQPLRSQELPDGLDDLQGLDFIRVDQANILYDFTAACADKCAELDKFFLCENPKESLFWITTPWAERTFQDDDVEQIHQACGYGSLRPKWTKLVCNFPELLAINAVCPGNHFHAPWGRQWNNNRQVFATALEVHYPAALCDAIAAAFLAAFKRIGIAPKLDNNLNKAARAFSDNQPAINKVATFLPDYKSKMLRILHEQHQVWPATPLDIGHAKLLHDVTMGGDDMQQLCFR